MMITVLGGACVLSTLRDVENLAEHREMAARTLISGRDYSGSGRSDEVEKHRTGENWPDPGLQPQADHGILNPLKPEL